MRAWQNRSECVCMPPFRSVSYIADGQVGMAKWKKRMGGRIAIAKKCLYYKLYKGQL